MEQEAFNAIQKRPLCSNERDSNQWKATFVSPLILDLQDHIGRIYAGFDKGIYLEGPRGFLWNIVDHPAKMNVYGVSLRTPFNSFYEVKQEDCYLFKRRRVLFPSRNVLIDLNLCRHWRPGPSLWKSKFSLKRWGMRRGEVDRLIFPLTKNFFTGRDTIHQLLSERIGILRSAVSKRDMEGALKAGYRLIGLGPGLTPMGDDFLCGFSLALFYLSHLTGVEGEGVERWQASIAREAIGKTVPFSSQALELAQRGESIWAVRSLLEKIFYHCNQGGVNRVGGALLTIGASTGAALLEGIRSGLSSFSEGFMDGEA